jgi:hypothetical protein
VNKCYTGISPEVSGTLLYDFCYPTDLTITKTIYGLLRVVTCISVEMDIAIYQTYS